MPYMPRASASYCRENYHPAASTPQKAKPIEADNPNTCQKILNFIKKWLCTNLTKPNKKESIAPMAPSPIRTNSPASSSPQPDHSGLTADLHCFDAPLQLDHFSSSKKEGLPKVSALSLRQMESDFPEFTPPSSPTFSEPKAASFSFGSPATSATAEEIARFEAAIATGQFPTIDSLSLPSDFPVFSPISLPTFSDPKATSFSFGSPSTSASVDSPLDLISSSKKEGPPKVLAPSKRQKEIVERQKEIAERQKKLDLLRNSLAEEVAEAEFDAESDSPESSPPSSPLSSDPKATSFSVSSAPIAPIRKMFCGRKIPDWRTPAFNPTLNSIPEQLMTRPTSSASPQEVDEVIAES